jgi:hypothetical protein
MSWVDSLLNRPVATAAVLGHSVLAQVREVQDKVQDEVQDEVQLDGLSKQNALICDSSLGNENN